MFPTDDVEIEIDRIVEIRQEIEDLLGNRDVVLPSNTADLKGMHDHELDDFQRRARNVKKKIDRRDNHQHSRDLMQEKHLASSIIWRVAVIEKRVLIEEFRHDQNIHGDDDRQREKCHQNQTPDIDGQNNI